MSITISQGIIIGVSAVCGLCLTLYLFYIAINDGTSKSYSGIALLVTILICVILLFSFNWYNNSTASGIRKYKDFKSEMSNGLNRELIITAEDGREIFKYRGKFDIERHEEGDDRYLRFESEDGRRYTISYGIQDTVIIIEKKWIIIKRL